MTNHDSWRGRRHLLVGVELSRRSVRVGSVTLVEQPAVQLPIVHGDIVVRIDIRGMLALLQADDDPRVIRGSSRSDETGHAFLTVDRGMLLIAVPLPNDGPLTDLTIRVADVARVRIRPVTVEQLSRWFDEPPNQMRIVGTLAAEDLRRHPTWADVGAALGEAPLGGARFEIYLDRAARYRWRLRRPDTQIVADSGQGYATREECEADLRWIRTAASQAPIESLDLA